MTSLYNMHTNLELLNVLFCYFHALLVYLSKNHLHNIRSEITYSSLGFLFNFKIYSQKKKKTKLRVGIRKRYVLSSDPMPTESTTE